MGPQRASPSRPTCALLSALRSRGSVTSFSPHRPTFLRLSQQPCEVGPNCTSPSGLPSAEAQLTQPPCALTARPELRQEASTRRAAAAAAATHLPSSGSFRESSLEPLLIEPLAWRLRPASHTDWLPANPAASPDWLLRRLNQKQ